MTDIIVGIDLGTTNSEVAIVREGRVEVIPVAPGVRILPSLVGVADDGQGCFRHTRAAGGKRRGAGAYEDGECCAHSRSVVNDAGRRIG